MGKQYTLLLKQGVGEAGTPVVKAGDTVQKGTLLAQANGVGVNLHASVDGVISVIDDEKIVIAANDEQSPEYVPIAEQGDVVQAVKDAGIVGLGGAGFPTHLKLKTDLQGGVLLVNAVECEPFLRHNIEQLETDAGLIRSGILHAMEAVNAARAIVAVKEKNRRACQAFREYLQPDDAIEIFLLPDLYPMGEERAVIRETLGTLLIIDQLPMEAQAVVLNLETVSCIARAVGDRRPLISKNLTVIGNLGGKRTSLVLRDIPIGTPISDVVAMAGGMPEQWGEVIVGGPFTGSRAAPDEVVTKTTGAVIVSGEFLTEERPLGLLVCACGANEARLRQLAESMNAAVVGVETCKQGIATRGTLKCENPGNCPGQAEKVLNLRKAGAKALLISNCTDCTNTVMSVAPKLQIAVHHSTDHVMRTMGHPLIRKMDSD